MNETFERDNEMLVSQGVKALNKRARKIIRQRLHENPDSGELWFKLGDLSRSVSRLDDAALAYQKALELGHQIQLSDYLVSLLGTSNQATELIYPEKEKFIPAPFTQTHNFLNSEELRSVSAKFDKHLYDLKPSNVGPIHAQRINSKLRQSVYLTGQNAEKFEGLIRAKLMKALKLAGRRFGLQVPQTSHLVTQVTSHGDGDFYRIHSDHGSTYPRLLSFVFYFSQQPQQFEGGELQLLDSDLRNECYIRKGTLLEPTHNSIIVFPSRYFHQVLPVKSSKIDRKYGRNSINGWLTQPL